MLQRIRRCTGREASRTLQPPKSSCPLFGCELISRARGVIGHQRFLLMNLQLTNRSTLLSMRYAAGNKERIRDRLQNFKRAPTSLGRSKKNSQHEQRRCQELDLSVQQPCRKAERRKSPAQCSQQGTSQAESRRISNRNLARASTNE